MVVSEPNVVVPAGPEVEGRIGPIARFALFGAQDGLSWRRESDATSAPIIGDFLRSHGISKVYAPDTHFDGVIHDEVSDDRLLTENHPDILLLPLKGSEGVTDLKLGEAVWLASADCPTVVLTDGEKLAVVHAGRWSLIPPFWKDNTINRRRASVIDNAVRAFPQHRWPYITASIHCGIAGDSFAHPLDHWHYGESNQQLLSVIEKRWPSAATVVDSVLYVSLPDVITKQLKFYGIRTPKWDGIDTSSEKFSGTDIFKWWSASRGDIFRNAVFVWRFAE